MLSKKLDADIKYKEQCDRTQLLNENQKAIYRK